MKNHPDELVTAIDGARIMDLSLDVVRLLGRDGRLPSLRTIGGVRLYRRGDAERLAVARAPSTMRRARPRKKDQAPSSDEEGLSLDLSRPDGSGTGGK